MAGKLTPEQLEAQLAQAAKYVRVGGLYQHYKGGEYKVLQLAFEEATMQIVVVYMSQHGTQLVFTRPLAVWGESIQWQGERVARFTLIEK